MLTEARVCVWDERLHVLGQTQERGGAFQLNRSLFARENERRDLNVSLAGLRQLGVSKIV